MFLKVATSGGINKMMATSNDTKMISRKYLRPERFTFAKSYPYGIAKKIDKLIESVLLMI